MRGRGHVEPLDRRCLSTGDCLGRRGGEGQRGGKREGRSVAGHQRRIGVSSAIRGKRSGADRLGIGSGILRGYKDTRSIFFITFTAYWVLGLPSGYLLALTDMIVPRMGPAGFWCGFIIGLTSAAIMMMLRMRFLQRQPSSIILQRAAR